MCACPSKAFLNAYYDKFYSFNIDAWFPRYLQSSPNKKYDLENWNLNGFGLLGWVASVLTEIGCVNAVDGSGIDVSISQGGEVGIKVDVGGPNHANADLASSTGIASLDAANAWSSASAAIGNESLKSALRLSAQQATVSHIFKL